MVKLQGVGRDLDFETTVEGRDRADTALGYADLNVLDRLSFLIDDPAADGNAFLCGNAYGKEQKRKYQPDSHSAFV